MNEIVCVGEALVDLIGDAAIADIARSERFRRAAGGAVANVAVGLARLGVPVAFVGAVGGDPLGRFLIETLAREGVDVAGTVIADAPTSLIFVSRGPHGARDFFPWPAPSAHAMLRPSDLRRDRIGSAAAVHAGGYMLALEPGRSACLAAFAAAGPHALRSFDPNVRPLGFADRDEMRTLILDAASRADLVKASSDDLESLGLADDPASLLRGATKAAVVTDGPRGCRFATVDGGRGSAMAPPIRAVDTTGAGDAFMAALLWRLAVHERGTITGDALSRSLPFAVEAGSRACLSEGAIASLPTRAELESAVARTTARP